jgi:hypothetical protein
MYSSYPTAQPSIIAPPGYVAVYQSVQRQVTEMVPTTMSDGSVQMVPMTRTVTENVVTFQRSTSGNTLEQDVRVLKQQHPDVFPPGTF